MEMKWLPGGMESSRRPRIARLRDYTVVDRPLYNIYFSNILSPALGDVHNKLTLHQGIGIEIQV
jgi:hypothetical protein